MLSHGDDPSRPARHEVGDLKVKKLQTPGKLRIFQIRPGDLRSKVRVIWLLKEVYGCIKSLTIIYNYHYSTT
jgi:hypothetical protein